MINNNSYLHFQHLNVIQVNVRISQGVYKVTWLNGTEGSKTVCVLVLTHLQHIITSFKNALYGVGRHLKAFHKIKNLSSVAFKKS